MTTPRHFLTLREVAAETGLSYDAIRRAIASGELTATRLRRRLLIRRDWFEAWVQAGILAPTASAMDLRQPHRRARASRLEAASQDVGSAARLLALESKEPGSGDEEYGQATQRAAGTAATTQ